MIELVFAVCLATDGDTLRCRLTPDQRATLMRVAPPSVKRRWRRPPTSLRIRLKAINAPERCETGGREAHQVLRALTYRRQVTCTGALHRAGEWSWSRAVMTCRVDGTDIGRRMVELGMAVACKQYGGRKYDTNAKRCTFTRCR